ncbi:MAG: ComF family protein [Oscillospiraceae bacterium]|nr:ComF family protein [Oscillospiraceae bacterium]
MGIFTPVLDLLFPPKCVFCRRVLRRERGVCSACAAELPACVGDEALQYGDFFSVCVSPLYYADTVRESHHRYKFGGSRWYASVYAPFVAACVAEHLAGRYDFVTWVPLSRKRLRKRGYDQARLLAEATAKVLDAVAVPTMKKIKHTSPLSGLGGKEERRANIAGVYRVLGDAVIADKRILLMDDIVTTGSSLTECAKCLLMAGAEEVLCATLARRAEER